MKFNFWFEVLPTLLKMANHYNEQKPKHENFAAFSNLIDVLRASGKL